MGLAKNHRIHWTTAALIAVANMVGTGVFTSLGYQVETTTTPFAIILLWVIGGIVALAGAFTYAELGVSLLRSGGEYHIISKLYHPSLGFVAGWISVIAGFSAPTALASMAFFSYARQIFPHLSYHLTCTAVVLLMSAIHALSVRNGGNAQNLFTAVKILVILIFVILGLASPIHETISLIPTQASWTEIASPNYFVSLVYVLFAYTGWNAVVYFVGEVRDPQKSVPRALVTATVFVIVLYALLNYVFLYLVPVDELRGKIEVASIAGNRILSGAAIPWFNFLMAFLMLSTIGAMIFLGARVTQVMGVDYRILSRLSRLSASGTPRNALIFQAAVILLFIYTSTFEQVILYTTFMLILMNNLAVAGVFILRRRRQARAFSSPGYPITPLVFLLINSAAMFYVVVEKPVESIIGTGIVSIGFLFYVINSKVSSV